MGKVEQLRALREQKWQKREAAEFVPVRQYKPVEVAAAPSKPLSSEEPLAETEPLNQPPLSPVGWEPGLSIHQYSDAAITAVVSEVLGSGICEPDAVLDEVMRLLGFQRRGKIIRQRVMNALAFLSEAKQVS